VSIERIEILNEYFHDFPQSLKANFIIVPCNILLRASELTSYNLPYPIS
jgi:hypothetical protein